MLTNVTSEINKVARNVVLNHPNAYLGELFRKVVERVSPTSMGGAPTLGGLGVISSDDEENISWTALGSVYALGVDSFEPSSMVDRLDANNGSADEYRYLIEPENLELFSINKHDVIYINKNDLVRLAFQIVDIETTSNIPPYTYRYVCNRRNELDEVA